MKKKNKKKISEGMAVIALLLNILLLPGLGTLIAGRITTGIIQVVLLFLSWILIVVGVLFLAFLIGIPILIIGCLLSLSVWIWSLITGIQLIKEAQA